MAVSVQITSSLAVNVAEPVRILINTKNPDQQGAIYDAPGTIVDVLPDPAHDRFYVLRQDRNQVLVFDGLAMTQLATLRTGNTPMQMAIYQDHLLVTNDNSQLVSVFDLPTLAALPPVWLSFVPCSTAGSSTGSSRIETCSYYPHSIAVANNSILTTSRNAGSSGPSQIISINLPDRIATAVEGTTFIYTNTVDVSSALAASPSGNSIFLTMPDGTVALYDTPSRLFVASRKEIGAVSGAYAALSDTAFFTGSFILGPSLVPLGQINLQGGISSGTAIVGGTGLLSSTPSGGVSGVLQRFFAIAAHISVPRAGQLKLPISPRASRTHHWARRARPFCLSPAPSHRSATGILSSSFRPPALRPFRSTSPCLRSRR